MTTPTLIYKISPRDAWLQAEQDGVFRGAPIDLADGYIHFSTAEQVAETASRHFTGQNDLLLAAINVADVDADLKWEVSRGGALFPHLYSDLSMEAVAWAKPMPLDANGIHQLPELES